MPPSSSELEPQVTVVIPTFNGGDWLLQTLASCQQQQPTSLEVIVVDDASTDDTPDRVAAAYPEVRLIRQPRNSGSGAHGRNTGLQLARGRYVKFLDHDDLLEPGTLPLEVQAAESQQADMVLCRWGDVRVNADGSLLESSKREFIPPQPDRVVEAILQGEKVPYTAGVLYRRSYIQEQRWDPRLTINDDFDWFCRNVLRGGRLVSLDHVSYYWRLHTGSLQGKQGSNPMAFVEAVLIRNHVYAEVMDSLQASQALTPPRAQALADRLYGTLRVLARFNTSRCEATLQRLQQLLPGYVPSPAVEPSSLIRRSIALCGLHRWIRTYGALGRVRDRLRPFKGQIKFYNE